MNSEYKISVWELAVTDAEQYLVSKVAPLLGGIRLNENFADYVTRCKLHLDNALSKLQMANHELAIAKSNMKETK